jgi:hypothetical protein
MRKKGEKEYYSLLLNVLTIMAPFFCLWLKWLTKTKSLYFPHFLLVTRNLNISKMFDWNEYSTQSNEVFYNMYSNHCPNLIVLCRGEDELLQYDNVLNWPIVLLMHCGSQAGPSVLILKSLKLNSVLIPNY